MTTTSIDPFPGLRPYQHQVASAIWRSVQANDGRSFSVMISRQGGKNEISARLEMALLLEHRSTGGTIVKTAPTLSPQLAISKRRLVDLLVQAGIDFSAEGDAITVGRASIVFLSGQPEANVVGHTASLLLEVDEAQDIDPVKFERDFRPMILATGATVVFYGTTWMPDSLLEIVKERHIALEAEDGVKRHFEFDYEAVGKDFPGYTERALEQRELLGPRNPVWLSQYQLQPQEGAGRLFTRAELESMKGDHEELPPYDGETVPPWRQRKGMRPMGVLGGIQKIDGEDIACRFVAGLDIGGRFASPERDATVLTICRLLSRDDQCYTMPRVEIIKQVSWRAQWNRIYQDLLEWNWLFDFEKLAVDSTGIGHHAAGQLINGLGKLYVDDVTFTAQSKSELCYELRDAVDSGRVKIHNGDTPDTRQFWQEAEKARVELRRGSVLMGFGVPSHVGHDDYLMSLALAVHAAHTTRSRFAYAYRRGDLL
jgi:hypothetical protein